MNQGQYSETDRTEYWDARHAEWAKDPDYQNLVHKDAWFEERFAHLLPMPSEPVDGSVLDVGCGCGIYAPALCRRYKHYEGFDTSPSAIEFAKQYFNKFLGVPGAHFNLRGNREDPVYGFEGVKFDLVFSCTVLQHMTIPERIASIEEIKGWLKPGGMYIGLEMQDGWAPDMPHWENNLWIEAWKPLTAVMDVPADHPDWAANNVWCVRSSP